MKSIQSLRDVVAQARNGNVEDIAIFDALCAAHRAVFAGCRYVTETGRQEANDLNSLKEAIEIALELEKLWLQGGGSQASPRPKTTPHDNIVWGIMKMFFPQSA